MWMCISHLGKRVIRVSCISIVPRIVAGIAGYHGSLQAIDGQMSASMHFIPIAVRWQIGNCKALRVPGHYFHLV